MKKIIIWAFICLIICGVSNAAECPYGLINDTYPGRCSLYIDENNNGICDYSEQPVTVNNTQNITAEKKQPPNYQFDLILATLICVLGYIITFVLYKVKTIKRKVHYRIWNIALTIAFSVVLITSLSYIFRIALNWWHIEFGIWMIILTFLHIHMYWKQFKRGF